MPIELTFGPAPGEAALDAFTLGAMERLPLSSDYGLWACREVSGAGETVRAVFLWFADEMEMVEYVRSTRALAGRQEVIWCGRFSALLSADGEAELQLREDFRRCDRDEEDEPGTLGRPIQQQELEAFRTFLRDHGRDHGRWCD